MNILIVSPTNNWASCYNHIKLPRLGPLRIAAEAKATGHEAVVYSEAISGPLENNWHLVNWADIIGFSMISAFAPDAYDLIKKIRQDRIDQKKVIIGGGVHATFAVEEAIKNGIDIVFRGPASMTARKFFQSNMDRSINGVSFMENGKIIHNPEASKKEDLDSLPPPVYDALHISKHYSRARFFAPIEITRSCPHKCDFCTVWKMLGPVTIASPETVIRDIQALQKGIGPVDIMPVDDNFSASRTRSLVVTEEINKAIKDKRIQRFAGTFQCSIKMPLDTEYLKAIRPVWGNIAVGLEDVRPNSYKKRGSLGDVERFFAVLNEWNFHIHAMMIIQPDMTWTEVKNTVRELRRLGAKSAQFTVLTPLLGSDLWNDLVKKGELDPKNQDWRRYNTFHPAPCYPQDTGDKMNRAWISFNSPRLVIEKILQRLNAGTDIKTSMKRSFIWSLGLWHPGLRWAWQNRGWMGLSRAIKWSLVG